MAKWIPGTLCVLALAAAAPDAGAVDPPAAVWTFRDVVLDDGGSISGHFTYAPATNSVTGWSVWSTGGNTVDFPIFQYRPDNSSLGQGSGGEIGFFVAGSQRQILFRPSVPLTGAPVFVPLYLEFPASSAYESFGGAAPLRMIQSGALFTDPAPTRVRWFLDGATFDDGGIARGYVDENPADSAILKAAIAVSGGNTAAFPALTYTLANSTGSIFPFFSTQLDHALTLQGSIRVFRYVGQAPLSGDGGRIALDGVYSVECYNCGPYRVLGGALRGVTDEVSGDGFE